VPFKHVCADTSFLRLRSVKDRKDGERTSKAKRQIGTVREWLYVGSLRSVGLGDGQVLEAIDLLRPRCGLLARGWYASDERYVRHPQRGDHFRSGCT
jgi:hypothetical protein